MKAALLLLSAAAAAALFLGGAGGDRMPQVAHGGDALSVAFADAKAAISAAMMQMADSYFHGGVDIDCHDAHGHDCGGHEGGDAHGQEDRGRADWPFDPWRWINRRIRAPETHVHLDDARAVEMLPWFWAAVRADSHNIDAWTTAAYAADRMMKDRALALRIVRRAQTENPGSLELAFVEARMVYDEGRGDVAAAERIMKRAWAGCRSRLTELSPRDAAACCGILNYLSRIYETRGDWAAMRPLLDDARATGARTPDARAIEERLRGAGRR